MCRKRPHYLVLFVLFVLFAVMDAVCLGVGHPASEGGRGIFGFWLAVDSRRGNENSGAKEPHCKLSLQQTQQRAFSIGCRRALFLFGAKILFGS